jgi:hypothetical protein
MFQFNLKTGSLASSIVEYLGFPIVRRYKCLKGVVFQQGTVPLFYGSFFASRSIVSDV